MKVYKRLRCFRNQLILEAALKALLSALAIGATGVFVISLIYHIFIRQPDAFLLEAVGGGIFVAVFLLIWIRSWPTEKKVAARLDALGLQERVSTMVEFREETTWIAQRQRQDAVDHIETLPTKRLPLQLGKRRCILCAISLCLAMGMLALPFDIFAPPQKPVSPEVLQQQMLREMISQLREDAKAEELARNTQDSLQQIIDQLEEDLKNAQTDLDKAAELQEAIQQMQQQAQQLSTRSKLGKALQKYEMTRPLGEGISENNTKKITSALDALEAALTADKSLPAQLNSTVVSALVESEVEDTDLLYAAIAELSYPMILLDLTAESYPQDLHNVFDEAKTAILEALKLQLSAEQQIGDMQQRLQDMMDRLFGNEPRDPSTESTPPDGASQPEEDSQQNPAEGDMPEGSQPPGFGNTDPNSSESGFYTMTEGIYDPISGNVAYGEVFAAYYAQYLKALEAGEVPQYLQEIMDRYFAALDK